MKVKDVHCLLLVLEKATVWVDHVTNGDAMTSTTEGEKKEIKRLYKLLVEQNIK